MQMALLSAFMVWQGRLCQRKAKIFFLLDPQADHFGLIEFSHSVPVTFHSVFSEFILVDVVWNDIHCLVLWFIESLVCF